MHKVACFICGGKSNLLMLILDIATRFHFCEECEKEAREEFRISFDGNYNLANWLRAIANVMDRKK